MDLEFKVLVVTYISAIVETTYIPTYLQHVVDINCGIAVWCTTYMHQFTPLTIFTLSDCMLFLCDSSEEGIDIIIIPSGNISIPKKTT